MAGDGVLADVANVLRQNLRAFDLAYRIGGEEFVVLVPGLRTPPGRPSSPKHLRAGIAAATARRRAGTVTMSFGVSASRPGGAFDFAAVIGEADAALYAAKVRAQPRPPRRQRRRTASPDRPSGILRRRGGSRGPAVLRARCQRRLADRETIGADLRARRGVCPTAALVGRHQDVRLTYAEFDARGRPRRPRAARRRASSAATASASGARTAPSGRVVQYATARAGVILVNLNPAYRTSELEYALQQSGCADAGRRRARSRPRDYVAMVERLAAPSAGRSSGSCFFDTDGWDELLAGGDEAGDDARWRAREAALDFDDPINIQYTSGTTGFPKGATLSHHNILNNGFFVGEGCGYTEDDRDLRPRALLPLLRHGHGQPRRDHARRVRSCCPARPSSRAPVLEAVAGRALHRALRRADDVHRRARPPGLRPTSTSARCAPGSWPARRARIEVMRRVIDRMHMEEVTICYGMTETSPVSTQTGADDELERRVAHGRPRRTRTSRSRSSTPTPAARCRAASRASSARAATR